MILTNEPLNLDPLDVSFRIEKEKNGLLNYFCCYGFWSYWRKWCLSSRNSRVKKKKKIIFDMAGKKFPISIFIFTGPNNSACIFNFSLFMMEKKNIGNFGRAETWSLLMWRQCVKKVDIQKFWTVILQILCDDHVGLLKIITMQEKMIF